MKVPAEVAEPENEVRDKRSKQAVAKGGNIFQGGVVNISYVVIHCKTRKISIGLAISVTGDLCKDNMCARSHHTEELTCSKVTGKQLRSVAGARIKEI